MVEPVSFGGLSWFDAGKKYRAFAVAKAFLSPADVEAIGRAAKHSSVREINDRKGYLAFKHRWEINLIINELYNHYYKLVL